MYSKEMKRENVARWSVYLKAVILGIIVTAVCVLLFAAVLLLPSVGRALSAPFASVSLAAGTIATSFYLAKKLNAKGYVVGALTGLAVFVAVSVVSMLIKGTPLTLHTFFRFLILLFSGLVGGIWGVNRKSGRKYLA